MSEFDLTIKESTWKKLDVTIRLAVGTQSPSAWGIVGTYYSIKMGEYAKVTLYFHTMEDRTQFIFQHI